MAILALAIRQAKPLFHRTDAYSSFQSSYGKSTSRAFPATRCLELHFSIGASDFPSLTKSCRGRSSQLLQRGKRYARKCAESSASLEALIFDCDGVILESEDLHRRAYNATFQHFDVRCGKASAPANWSTDFYDILQNKIGGGKPKMRWYFNENGWPTTIMNLSSPATEEEQTKLIDTLQDWKTEKYKDMIASGGVEARPGVLRVMDSARAKGAKLAVCSAATKSSVIFCLENLLGKDRFASLDCFMAGDDVDKKKPDPTIYRVASQRLAVAPDKCLVVEDSLIGLQAARGAGMKCVITYTSSTQNQEFEGASAIYSDLASISFEDLARLV